MQGVKGTSSVSPGQRFGRLTVIGLAGYREYKNTDPQRLARVRCRCGTTKEVNVFTLTSRSVKSCGCIRREGSKRRMRKLRLNSGTNNPARRLRFGGRVQSMAAWARELGVSPGTLQARLNRGWGTKRALSTPVGNYTR